MMRWTIGITLLAFAGACGGGDPGTAGSVTVPVESQDVPDAGTLHVTCGSVELGNPADMKLPDAPLDDTAAAALEEATSTFGGEAELFSVYEWSVAVREESRLVLFGRATEESLEVEAPYADVVLVHDGTFWAASSWGQCRLVVDASGWGNATAVLDPENEPESSDTELSMLIRERACAGGRPPIGREVVPVVVYEEGRIVVTVLVEPVEGVATCQGTPWHPITIALDQPLGDREIFDGSTVPALPRPWPPTQESIEG